MSVCVCLLLQAAAAGNDHQLYCRLSHSLNEENFKTQSPSTPPDQEPARLLLYSTVPGRGYAVQYAV